ncbi:MAG: 2-C-methyl-D-erythritol 4-phosphate cytidylyltransferase [Desulfomonile sp.]|nr:2-C-methyl-D-erythritol 4-phosphate cytidylyltransferase [Deltaproteobacteria bacterium]
MGDPYMTCAALITAAGYGKRMGADVPKQYLHLEGLPILVRTVQAFVDHPMIERIVLTAPPSEEEYCRNLILESFEFNEIIEIVSGGAARQASVYNGLKHIANHNIVVIHDGVRPLVTSDVITRTIEAALHSGAAIACVPVRETVKKKNGSCLETISRSNFWFAHTPQTFQTSLIITAHKKALEEGFTGTDDAVLVERMNHTVTLVEDSEDNIKITTPTDLELAALLLRRRERPYGSTVLE